MFRSCPLALQAGGGAGLYLPSEENNDYMYGKASRPSTPIEFLMTNSYQRSFVEDQKDRQVDEVAVTGGSGGGGGKRPVRHTKATLARDGCIKDAIEYSQVAKEDFSWKMSKFADVPSRLNA
eukprot:SAG22_NODE_3351_length_1763_cov_2.019832_3_plen_122_part_00